MTRIAPFHIDVPQRDIDDLRARLAATRLPAELPDVGWSYGVPPSYLRRIGEYWRTGYHWRRHEAALNAHPQFVARIDGHRMHFTHVRSGRADALPLVLLHGWPFADFSELIGPLTDGGAAQQKSFDLVIPALPGFGFSGPTLVAGAAGTDHGAALVAELMDALGYQRYGVHGGDAGGFVAAALGRLAPDRVVGVHLNDPITIPSGDEDGTGYSTADLAKLARLRDWSGAQNSAYAAIHGTRPQTLAPAVNDSPAGLLAWVIDVIHTFMNPDKELPEQAIPIDALLTCLSIIWFTGTIGSSLLVYKESGSWTIDQPNLGVPTGIALFPGNNTIRAIAAQRHTVVHWSELDRGGHFASMEAPDLLAADLRAFFSALG